TVAGARVELVTAPDDVAGARVPRLICPDGLAATGAAATSPGYGWAAGGMISRWLVDEVKMPSTPLKRVICELQPAAVLASSRTAAARKRLRLFGLHTLDCMTPTRAHSEQFE